MVRRTIKRHTNKRRQRKYKKQTRRSGNRKRTLRQTKNRRQNKKQRGGYNKNKNGNITYLSTDKRYRPAGSIFDTVKFKANSLMNSMQGKYSPVNPSVSKQPIGNVLSANDLKIGVGSPSDARKIFKQATIQAATYA